MDDILAPVFPPELERLIFEIASINCGRVDVINILLVAKRVHDWIRPTLYRVLKITTASEGDDIAEREDFRYCHAKTRDVGIFIRYLLINSDNEGSGMSVLELCPEVEDLALWVGKQNRSHLSLIKRLPLRCFSADLSDWSANDLQGPAFSNLTHLDVIELTEGDDCERWNIVTSLPKLTHLSLNCIVGLPVLRYLLSQCPHLCFLIMLELYGTDDTWAKSSQGYITIDDPRLVLINCYDQMNQVMGDWVENAHGRFGLWDFSERFVEARRLLLLKDNSQQWISRNLDWTKELNENGREWYDSKKIWDGMYLRER